ncbi:MAG: hypothetical protein J0G29_02810 [Alphaproteobacteria bacterium]|nr:hypothetical protein [Alphaproteobacteria bacterium]
MKKIILSATLLVTSTSLANASLFSNDELDLSVGTLNPILARAVNVMQTMSQANERDIETLQAAFTTQMGKPQILIPQNLYDFAQQTIPNFKLPEGAKAVIENASSDEAQIAIAGVLIEKHEIMSSRDCYMKEDPSNTGTTFELRSSVNKLLGTSQFSGILDDTVTMILNEYNTDQWLQNLTANRMTVAKYALYYLLEAAQMLRTALSESDTSSEETAQLSPEFALRNLNLVYPAQYTFEGTNCRMTLKDTSLEGSYNIDKNVRTLLVPNAGYVFGGNLVYGKIKGLDCSSFVSYVANSTVRMSTYLMAQAAIAMGAPFSESDIGWPMSDVEKVEVQIISREFDLVQDQNNIQPGDLITWRSPKAGHTAVFMSWPKTSLQEVRPDGSAHPIYNTTHFVGIDANREDDKSKEGVNEGIFSYERNGRKTFALRRK